MSSISGASSTIAIDARTMSIDPLHDDVEPVVRALAQADDRHAVKLRGVNVIPAIAGTSAMSCTSTTVCDSAANTRRASA